MELIDKIQEYVHGVCNKERKIRSDKEDYSHGKFAVASVVSKIIEDHEPEPPKLRPMSELPEENIFVNILIEHDTRFWGDGFVCLNRVELRYLGQDLWKQQDYKTDIGVKALGWLPKEELPNPNDIKL